MSDVLVPRAVLRDPARFGGVAVGEMLRGVPIIEKDRIAGLAPPRGGDARIVIPRLVEAHCHLDKCHSAHRLGVIGGDLTTAIDRQRADKENWTREDLTTRATRGLAEARAAGCTVVRSHVDWGDGPEAPLAWQVLPECVPEGVSLQRAALTGVRSWADPAFARPVARLIARDNAVLGAFVFDQPGYRDGLRAMFDHATRLGLPLDFHVDEGLGDLNGLEAIADAALAVGFEGPILCGHAVSLMDRDGEDLARITDKLLAARIAVCALPTTNLYLQGRTGGTPDRRGITRLRELRAAGVPILVGSDNVSDAFCPTGAHDPMAALNLAVLGAHLDPPLEQWLPAITTDAATALGLDPPHVDITSLEHLVVHDTAHCADIVAGRAAVRPATEELT
ncbi:MAG: amidohydrolase family protein [Pseudomonadota bacterium]